MEKNSRTIIYVFARKTFIDLVYTSRFCMSKFKFMHNGVAWGPLKYLRKPTGRETS